MDEKAVSLPQVTAAEQSMPGTLTILMKSARDRIRDAMGRAGVTQGQVAEACGDSRPDDGLRVASEAARWTSVDSSNW